MIQNYKVKFAQTFIINCYNKSNVIARLIWRASLEGISKPERNSPVDNCLLKHV